MSLVDFVNEQMKVDDRQETIRRLQAAIDRMVEKQKTGWKLSDIAKLISDPNYKDVLDEVYWRPNGEVRVRMSGEQRTQIKKAIYDRITQLAQSDDKIHSSDLAPDFEKNFQITRVVFGQILSSMVKDGHLKAEKDGREYVYKTGKAL